MIIFHDLPAITCPTLMLEHGTINSTEAEYGSIVKVTCDGGYKHNEHTHAIITCTDTGQWSEEIECQGKNNLLIIGVLLGNNNCDQFDHKGMISILGLIHLLNHGYYDYESTSL